MICRARRILDAALAAAILSIGAPAAAQVDGHVSVLADVLPDLNESGGIQHVAELRARVFLERRQDVGSRLRLNLAAYIDGLVGDRETVGGSGLTREAIIRPADLYAEVVFRRFDLRVGSSRLVWGRLDEFQPTDIVNPIDLTRFLFEGRTEARLPVGLVRGRVFLPGGSTIEAVMVPVFRASRYDELAEDTSPFNLTALPICTPAHSDECQPLMVLREEPAAAVRNVQGGARFTSTVGRVDWAVTGYRGFRTFPTFALSRESMRASYSRFTMVGGDFETVRGAWGLRGELAVFLQDTLQAGTVLGGVPGGRIDSGLGVDRRAGEYRVAVNLLWSYENADAPEPIAGVVPNAELDRADVTVVAAAERRFARDTRTARVLAAYDPADATIFVRGIGALNVRENVWLEGSVGAFAGSADDTFGRLTRRDFLYARLRVHF